jgi:hypothetical protein
MDEYDAIRDAQLDYHADYGEVIELREFLREPMTTRAQHYYLDPPAFTDERTASPDIARRPALRVVTDPVRPQGGPPPFHGDEAA